MSKSTKKCRIYMDGNSWCCVGPKFKNLQESASGFGDTPEESYTDYQADVIAMKAAKKLAKAVKQSRKDAAAGNVKPLSDLKADLKDRKKKAKKSDKGSRNTRVHKTIVKAFKNGLTRAQTITLALKKNSKFNTPLCPAEVTNLVRIEWERLNPPSK